MKKNRKKEFADNRTSWKFFERLYREKFSLHFQDGQPEGFMTKVLVEILKELQYLNDRKS
jgi:hypothetical protein